NHFSRRAGKMGTGKHSYRGGGKFKNFNPQIPNFSSAKFDLLRLNSTKSTFQNEASCSSFRVFSVFRGSTSQCLNPTKSDQIPVKKYFFRVGQPMSVPPGQTHLVKSKTQYQESGLELGPNAGGASVLASRFPTSAFDVPLTPAFDDTKASQARSDLIRVT